MRIVSIHTSIYRASGSGRQVSFTEGFQKKEKSGYSKPTLYGSPLPPQFPRRTIKESLNDDLVTPFATRVNDHHEDKQ